MPLARFVQKSQRSDLFLFGLSTSIAPFPLFYLLPWLDSVALFGWSWKYQLADTRQTGRTRQQTGMPLVAGQRLLGQVLRDFRVSSLGDTSKYFPVQLARARTPNDLLLLLVSHTTDFLVFSSQKEESNSDHKVRQSEVEQARASHFTYS